MKPITEVPEGVQSNYSLARLSTIRTGGSAQYFARPCSAAQLQSLLQWAAAARLHVGVVGSGSNLLIADDGVLGLVLKLDKDLSVIEQPAAQPHTIVCGGGARLPAVSAAAARAGLAGIEFGVSIPGTVGGAVRMNANAYGGELASVLEWVDVVSAQGSQRRQPSELGFQYRKSNLQAGEVVARVSFQLKPAPPATVTAMLTQLRDRRKASQPAGIKTFGSTFKNPAGEQAQGRTAGQLLDAAGCRGKAVGGARFSPKHANFVENFNGASTADVVALMDCGRKAVKQQFGIDLEPEVQALGAVAFPADWRRDAAEDER